MLTMVDEGVRATAVPSTRPLLSTKGAQHYAELVVCQVVGRGGGGKHAVTAI